MVAESHIKAANLLKTPTLKLILISQYPVFSHWTQIDFSQLLLSAGSLCFLAFPKAFLSSEAFLQKNYRAHSPVIEQKFIPSFPWMSHTITDNSSLHSSSPLASLLPVINAFQEVLTIKISIPK